LLLALREMLMLPVLMSTLLKKGYNTPGRQVAVTSEFCTVASNVCGSSVWTLFHVTLLAAKFLKCLLGFWKICSPLF